MKSFKKNRLHLLCQQALIAMFATGVMTSAYAQQESSDDDSRRRGSY